ncbi:MAG: YwbE family protein [Polaribacter sp.]|nr:YwbE family protein [Polaribacter sp.]
MILDARKRANIKIGIFVEIVLKANQRTGELTQGVVTKILTKSVSHPYGIKVQLESGLIGRVKNII